ncbi:hypothetical protein BKA69DRAFT_1083011 [Paraphysoderma sedebokerense]|nr:hypothetical protein BKA69DRAFT_1083011 [Paraphysoderma sedebokerense]
MLPSQNTVPTHQSSQCNPIPSQIPTQNLRILRSDNQLFEFTSQTGPSHAYPDDQDSHLVPPNGLQRSVSEIIPPETDFTTRPQKQIGPRRCFPDIDTNLNDVNSKTPVSQRSVSQYSNPICCQPWGVGEQMSLISTILPNPQKRGESDYVYWFRISSLHRRLYPERSTKAVQDEWDSMHNTFNFITDWMRFNLSGSAGQTNWWNLDSEVQRYNLSRAKKVF